MAGSERRETIGAGATDYQPWPGLEAIVGSVAGRPELLYVTLLDLRMPATPTDEAICSLSAWPTAFTESGRFAVGAIASAADRALIYSVIPPTENSLEYTTVSLTVRLLHEPDPRFPVTAHAQARPGRSSAASSACTLVDGTGREIGTASGTFVGGRRSTAGDGSGAARPSDQRLAASDEPLDQLPRSLGSSPSYRRLLDLRPTRRGEDRLEATFDVVPYLWNTASYLHGGVVFGAAAELATDLVAGWRVVEQHCVYLSGLARGRVRLSARLLRRGRRVAFAAVDAFDPEDRPIASLLCTLVAR